MNHDKTFVYVFTIYIAIFCCVPVIAKSSSRLLSIDNLGDKSNADNGYLISSLSAQVKESKKKVKSIAVYRQNPISKEMILQDSILFNKKGLPVLRLAPYSENYYKTFYYYDQKGRPYLNIYVISDRETLYTLNQYNSTELQIQYRVKAKEIEYLIEKEVIPISDSVVQLKRMQYQQDSKLKKNRTYKKS